MILVQKISGIECWIWKRKLHPGKLTWNLKITCLKRKIIFQTSIFGFHVNFQGCTYLSDFRLLGMSDFVVQDATNQPPPNFRPKKSPKQANRLNFAGLGVNLQHASLTAPWPHTYSLLLQIVRRLLCPASLQKTYLEKPGGVHFRKRTRHWRRRPLQNKDQLPMACTLTWSRLEYFTPFNGKPENPQHSPNVEKLPFGGVNCWDLDIWWIHIETQNKNMPASNGFFFK